MVFIDPYCITLIVTERIRRLMEAGHLAEIEPDHEYGYTCQLVFGISIDDIAAIRDEHTGVRQLLWFHLNDGRIVSGSPESLGCGGCPGRILLH